MLIVKKGEYDAYCGNALYDEDMKVLIKKERCKECGLCVAHCPKKAISYEEHVNKDGYHPVKIDDDLCIGCGFCYITCPDGVYHVLGGEK